MSLLPDPEDTIVALSSAAGPGARAIVHLSGRRAAAIAAAVCPGFEKELAAPGVIFHGGLRLPGFHAPIATDVYHFTAPRTFTGQDVIEFHTISCEPIVEVLIAECLNAGARAAQRGEFTLRAFLAGKLDLTRAEAVLAVIEAKERDELRGALKQLAGGMAQPLAEVREDLLNLLADVEAALDFTEEGIEFVSAEDLLKRLAKALAYLTLLRKQVEQRALGQRPLRVALAGPPNAGKSSLFNALVGEPAALVSAEPGTTRDYLEKIIVVDGVRIQLIDTAGQRESSDPIESAAQALGNESAHAADLILWCCPWPDSTGSVPSECTHHAPRDDRVTPTIECFPGIQRGHRAERDEYTPTETWRIVTKSDSLPPDLAPASAGVLATSVVTGEGLHELRARLVQQARHAGPDPLAPSLSRCRHHIEAALQHLRQAHRLVIDRDMPELLALELRLALDEIGAMSGTIFTDDLLDRVFSRFCIGK